MTVRSKSPYVPTYLKAAANDSKPVQLSYSDFNLSDSNVNSSDSFKYDPLGYPLKSTQQLNIDWSKFENHTFFSSAEVKVNEAFNRIINSYPFDGAKKEVEQFLDSLTGFEKWIFDSFPTWSGALHFSGTQVGEVPSATAGNWITIKDKAGNLYPDLAKNRSGNTVLNPQEDDSLSVEFLVKLPAIANGTQVIFQKAASPSLGFTFYIENTSSTDTVNGVFSVSSGSFNNSVTCEIKKGSYNHLCLILNKQDTREHSLQAYVNEALYAESKNQIKFSKLGIDEADFLIGSGSSFFSKGSIVTPTQTFSGTLDDFKVFHSVRDLKMQKLHLARGIYSSPDLKLYYRFNEPSGSLSLNGSSQIESIVLDSSGNSLHSNVNNFKPSLRVNVAKEDDNLMTQERQEFKKILFPAYKEVLDFNSSLLVTASNYDLANPNNIIRLIPQHYLLEGALQEGYETVEGNGGNPYGGSGIPGQGSKGSVQIILTFLYVWAKFFDEIKTYIDSFGMLKTVNYDTNDTVPDNFLEDMVRNYGFYLPKFFSHANVEQFTEGLNVEGLSDLSVPLKQIQTTILRRVLINIPDILRSKGTQHSIKSFLRSVGIDPNNSIRIREYGGSTTKQLTTARENVIEPLAMVEFTGSALVTTTPLSASRVEPGYPQPGGVFYRDSFGMIAGTTSASDGLLTSGSWHLEGLFKFPPDNLREPNGGAVQSLMRLATTGSAAGSDPALILNVIATQRQEFPEINSKVKAYLRPGTDTNSPLLKMELDLPAAGIFDGDKWNVSFGCVRNDEFGSIVSSSYYLRVGKSDAGEISQAYVTSSYFYEKISSEQNVLRDLSSNYNASGSYIFLGSNQYIPPGTAYRFLNNSIDVDSEARSTTFVGWGGNVRFWSKSMNMDEWKEHVRNPRSVGVADALKNYNYVKTVSGSFQKLRLDTLSKQTTRTADAAGNIRFLDFSQNGVIVSGSGFTSGSKVVVGDVFNYTYISPMFDEAATNEKVRIRSFESNSLLDENPWAVPAPTYASYQRFLSEEPIDDPRLSLEFSLMDSLDRDIVNMFSSLDKFNDYLGSPELMFSPDYPDLDRLRDVYFNRLSEKPDFRKFLEFYKWFDISISSFIEQLVPKRTAYKGTNFVIESHMLERHKNVYRHSDNYLGARQVIQDSLLLQQIVGKLKKY